MPRTIRYVKKVGTLEQGYEERRSDIDANILSALGVAEILPEGAEPEEASMKGETLRTDKKTKERQPKKEKVPKTSRGYRRRDMAAERRP